MFHLIDHGTVWDPSSGQLDVDRVCSIQNVEPRDVWLVDSAATDRCILPSFVQFQGAQEAQQDGHSSECLWR